MKLSVEVPDAIAACLHLDGAHGSRRALEMLAAAGYRNGDLSQEEVGELLSLESGEAENFLQKREAFTR